jgi:hypothetical protein
LFGEKFIAEYHERAVIYLRDHPQYQTEGGRAGELLYTKLMVYELGKTATAGGAPKPSGTGRTTTPKGTASGPASRGDLIKAIRKFKEDLRTIRSKTFKESQFKTMAADDVVKFVKELTGPARTTGHGRLATRGRATRRRQPRG